MVRKIKPEKFHIELKGWGKEIFLFHPLTTKSMNNYPPCFPRPYDNLKIETIKLLIIEKNKKGSSHFHIEKKELFVPICGKLEILFIEDGKKEVIELNPFEAIYVPPGLVHQIKGLEDVNVLLELSSLDKPEDSYRIEKGD